jgi:hypothetical protein
MVVMALLVVVNVTSLTGSRLLAKYIKALSGHLTSLGLPCRN